jgi:hypothetical protein
MLVAVGFYLNIIFFHYAFHPEARVARAVTEGFLGYVAAVPLVLFFLKGERAWRWAVFGVWCLYVAVFAYVMLTMD